MSTSPNKYSLRSVFRFFLWLVALAAGTSAHANTISADYFGLHIHRAENEGVWPTIQFGSWRLWDARVQWMHLQPTRATWDFSKLDGYVNLAGSHGVSLLMPLGLTPKWASARPNERSAYGFGTAAEPFAMEDWRIYVRTVAQRYKGRIKAYELWNEPNDKRFFSGSTATLVDLSCEAYRILKEVDPSVTVVGPAYTHIRNVPSLEKFLSSGGGKCIDVVSYHLYIPKRPPEDIPALIKQIKLVMKRQGVEGLPLWNTESGWAIKNRDGTPGVKVSDSWLKLEADQSGSYVARSYLLGAAFGLDRFYWYAWDSTTFGLIEPRTMSPKSGGVALGKVVTWLSGKPRPACVEKGGVWQCVLSSSPKSSHWVMWSPDSKRTLSPPTGWRIKHVERADGRVEVDLSDSDLHIDDLPRLFILEPSK